MVREVKGGGKTRPQSMKGAGIGLGSAKRHRKILRDNIRSITKGDIRRLARRGGIKRISAGIYDETREVIRSRLEEILKQCVALMEARTAKTVTARDVIFILQRMGKPIWGFDPDYTIKAPKA